MKKVVVLLALIMSGCSLKITYTSIANYSGGDTEQHLSADGATVTTETDQAADGKLDANLTGL